MRAPILAVAAMALVPLAGCVEDMTDGELGAWWIEGQVVVDGQAQPWSKDFANHTINLTKLVLGKTEPGPHGGGGVRRTLDFGANVSLRARLGGSASQGPVRATWSLQNQGADGTRSVEQGGNETFVMEPAKLGKYSFYVQVSRRGGGFWSSSTRTFQFYVEGRATVDSAVQPVQATAVPPPNYDEMSDVFEFKATSNFQLWIEARTRFRGNWPAMHGTDVDLGLQDGNERMLVCRGQGGRSHPEPHPSQASERLSMPTMSGSKWTVFVGAPPDCPGAFNPSYANAWLVPYELTLDLYYRNPSEI